MKSELPKVLATDIVAGLSNVGKKKAAKGKTKGQSRNLEYSKMKVFEVAVVATMSSGKSTFINALMGKDLLPSQNEACTTRTTAVLDNDGTESTVAHILFDDGHYSKIADCDATMIANYINSVDNGVSDIVVECNIPGIRNIRKSLLVVDTPGTNNNADSTHEEITKAYLSQMDSGLIIYLINATQIGTDDDKELLCAVKEIMEESPGINILFLLNKADELDPEKKPIDDTVKYCLDYLKTSGFQSPRLYPVSSEASLLFRKAISGAHMTKNERSEFQRYYTQYTSNDLRLSLYAVHGDAPQFDSTIIVGNRAYLNRELVAAFENTGLPAVEKAIEDYLIQMVNSKSPKIRKPSKKKREAK